MNPDKPNKIPPYAEILESILASVNGPLPVKELADEILRQHPSSSKNPHRLALAKIREEEGRCLVHLDPDRVLPLRLAYQGARYRIRLSREIVDRATLPLQKSFRDYLPSRLDWDQVRFIDSQDAPIPFKIVEVPHEIAFIPNEKVEYKEPAVVLREWFRAQRMYFKDQILVTIEDWERGVIRLERERLGLQLPEQVAESNRRIADQFYAMLEAAKAESIYIHIALPAVYAGLADKHAFVPDHWAAIVANDPRLVSDGWTIHYPDSGFSMLEQMAAEMTGQRKAALVQPRSKKEEGLKVYRWRASLARVPTIWRELEILGRQTLTDFDSILRDAFQHDPMDHLSGFWKRVLRSGGSGKRYREVEIGDVNPFEPTAEEETTMASLDLKVGDQLKYVYDFGDWIEHTLELKSIGEPAKDVEYPQEVARNQPQYQYCVECLNKGTQTNADWICITCSNEEGKNIFLCEDCLDEHEEHYTDNIRY
jgi:hypothetical protein